MDFFFFWETENKYQNPLELFIERKVWLELLKKWLMEHYLQDEGQDVHKLKNILKLLGGSWREIVFAKSSENKNRLDQ